MSTPALVKNIVNTSYDSLPGDAREATKKSILDIIGVMLPPTTLVDTCISVYELMKEAGGAPESTIVGFGGKLPCMAAAFVNGSLTHAIDFDDCVGIEKPIVHPTGSSFPAALAIAEKIGKISGKEFITAVTLGNDLMTRLGSCPKGNVVTDYPFFPITVFGVFSSAVVSGKLLGLNEGEMVNTFGLALNRVSGVTKGLFGSDLRAIRDGLNAKEGILCALLAGKGMDACKDAVEILFNVFFNDDVNTEYLTTDLGKKFRGEEAGFKPWPSCQGTHSYIQAVLQIVNEHNIRPEQITEIILKGNKEGDKLSSPSEIKRKPISSITAKTALPFVVAVAIVYRNVSITNFLPENLNDPKVLAIAEKVKFKLDNALGSYSSRVEIKTKDGKSLHTSVDILRGSLQNPLSVKDLVDKFTDCARYSRKDFSSDAIERLIDSILNLEKVKDISEITDLLG
jgi:2-methylcitrate dehydratase PrpD